MKQKKSPSQEGLDYEKRFEKDWGGKRQPGSGNTPFFKLDKDMIRLLIGLKFTAAKSYRVQKSDLDEIIHAVYGPGGLGDDYTPVQVVEIDGQEIAMLQLNDLVKLLQQEVKVFAPKKKHEKNARANSTSLSRKISSDDDDQP